jgi:hypothetical protein
MFSWGFLKSIWGGDEAQDESIAGLVMELGVWDWQCRVSSSRRRRRGVVEM